MKFSSKSLIFYVRFKHADIRSRIKAMPSDIYAIVLEIQERKEAAQWALSKLSLENDSLGRCSPGLPIVVPCNEPPSASTV